MATEQLPPKLRAADPPQRNRAVTRAECPNCRDTGQHFGSYGTLADVREALDRGAIALCTCAKGQWWLAMLYDSYGPLLDRHGKQVGNPHFRIDAGVPDGLFHGNQAVAWLTAGVCG
jgi:hypothetical protein